MLLENYEKQGLLVNMTVLGKAGSSGIGAFRGDFVLKEGELHKGKTTDRKPPELLMYQAAILADASRLLFVNGLFLEVEDMAIFVDKYRAALTPETLFLCYVENIDTPMQIELDGLTFNCIPYKEGMVWNETMELVYIEKADLKGQSAEEKVQTVFDAAKQYKPKGNPISYEEALKLTIVVKKSAAAGPV
ncbi:MAG: hypothetical protein IPN42_10150 [Methylococcaceae bacterium]|nr:hypothetical protein [Methylococcaceae bacterium]